MSYRVGRLDSLEKVESTVWEFHSNLYWTTWWDKERDTNWNENHNRRHQSDQTGLLTSNAAAFEIVI